MPECTGTCAASKEEVPRYVDSILKDHKVVGFTSKDEKKGEEVVDVIKGFDVKDLDIDKCSHKDELLKVLKQKTSCTSTPVVFIGGQWYCGAELAASDTAEKEKLKKRLQECSCW